ncbi:ATP-binding cassette domain-containing protein [Ruminococcaceae bacterium OttesenSCG-928-O06]|nr:ATP-binding cassette domain-containing protein [Ruminococcaceae bacterium OttesenSCG-928-O06]
MLELKNVSFSAAGAEGNVEILDDISFALPTGKILVITGPNGGGKSTLARLIMGIEAPTAGQIFWNGEDITHLGIPQRAQRGIGYAFQQPAKFKGIKIRRLLELAGGHEMSEMECCAYLSKVGLCAQDYIDRDADASLSGGELKRVEIATLLARKPQLSIYDEPEAGIDLWSFSMLVETFRTLRQDADQSIVIISHQERILQLADDIMVIAGGKITQYAPREQVLPRLKVDEAEDGVCPAPAAWRPVDTALAAK